MNFFQSAVLGIVEGLTEFLPISSTFHLILTSRLLTLSQTEYQKLFEVVIQSGAILSLLARYFPRLLSSTKLRRDLILSFIPTAVLGLALYRLVKGLFFDSFALQLSVFALVGLLFLVTEHLVHLTNHPKTKGLSDITPRDAIIIGAVQALSMIPGVSRSGSILLSMLILGYSRHDSAEYAFLLSLPTIFAATTLDLYKNTSLLLSLDFRTWLILGVGVVSATTSALIVMNFLLKYLTNHNLKIFGYYRLALSLLLVIMLF